MKLLVIGGTRFIGPYVIRQLHAREHEITVLHRGEHGADLPADVRHIHEDRRRLPELRNELRRLSPEVVLDMRPISEEDARGLMDVFRAIARRAVAISSADVYRAYGVLIGTEPGPIVPSPATEDSPLRERLYPYRGETPRAEDDPARWQDAYDKIPVECLVMGDPEIQGTVLRLPMVYGPGGGQHRLFSYLRRMDDGRPAILLGERTARWRSPHGYVENVAAAIALAVADDRAARRIYNVAEAGSCTEAEWVQRIGRAAGWEGEVVAVPEALLPDHLAEQGNLEQHLDMDSTRSRQELGYAEVVPVGEAMRRAVEWERANPPGQVDPAELEYAAEDELLARIQGGRR